MEYARWLEEHNRQISELRAGVTAHASDSDLRSVVEKIMSHYDEIFRLKGNAAKADVFHVLSGMWKTPAERCFMWLGGFRPSEVLKVCNVLILQCAYGLLGPPEGVKYLLIHQGALHYKTRYKASLIEMTSADYSPQVNSDSTCVWRNKKDKLY